MSDCVTIICSTQHYHTDNPFSTYQLNEPIWVTSFKKWLDTFFQKPMQATKPAVDASHPNLTVALLKAHKE